MEYLYKIIKNQNQAVIKEVKIMKIGIFTFFQTNYGAVLQAFALQHYLEQQPGTEVEIVDFTTPNHLLDHKVFQKQKTRNPISLISYFFFTLIHYRQLKRRINRTWEFKKKYFHFTRRYSSVEDVLKNHPKEDLYITGSDQVFNPNARYVPVYYLDFDKENGKKVAYAPSFGISEFSSEISQKIERYVRDFDYLSCREQAGASFLGSIVDKEIPVVVDPVFLHNAEEWSKIASIPSFKRDYIFVYDLNGGDSLIKIAKNIQKSTQLPIVCLTRVRNKFYPVEKQCYDAGPAEFLGWIENASCVVTDSFHGTAFSLIFGREFFSYIALEKTSARIKNILKQVGLDGRIVTKKDLNSFNYLSYPKVKIADTVVLSQKSKEYIQSFLK